MIEYIKSLYNKYKIILILGLTTFIFLCTTCLSIRSCISYKEQGNNNVIALTDTIKYYKTKNGELYVSKTLLEGDLSTLKIANDSLYGVIKEMKIKNPTSVVYVDATIDNGQKDTAWIIEPITTNIDSVYIYPSLYKEFDFSDKFRELTGNIYLKDSLLGLNILKDKINFDYTLAIENNKVFVKSNNPYIHYNEIQGLTLKPQSNRKFTLVIGPSINYSYDLNSKKWGPSIGVSATYGFDILKIFKK